MLNRKTVYSSGAGRATLLRNLLEALAQLLIPLLEHLQFSYIRNSSNSLAYLSHPLKPPYTRSRAHAIANSQDSSPTSVPLRLVTTGYLAA